MLALAATHHDVELSNEEALVALASHLDVQFTIRDGAVHTILEGEAVSGTLRTEQIGNAASKVAAFPRVREALLRRQRAFRALPGLIADGRDMGTVVFRITSYNVCYTKLLRSAILMLMATSSHAASGDTLAKVQKAGELRCGVSDGLPGFSNPDAKGNWKGIDADFCRAVAAATLGDANKVKFIS